MCPSGRVGRFDTSLPECKSVYNGFDRRFTYLSQNGEYVEKRTTHTFKLCITKHVPTTRKGCHAVRVQRLSELCTVTPSDYELPDVAGAHGTAPNLRNRWSKCLLLRIIGGAKCSIVLV